MLNPQRKTYYLLMIFPLQIILAMKICFFNLTRLPDLIGLDSVLGPTQSANQTERKHTSCLKDSIKSSEYSCFEKTLTATSCKNMNISGHQSCNHQNLVCQPVRCILTMSGLEQPNKFYRPTRNLNVLQFQNVEFDTLKDLSILNASNSSSNIDITLHDQHI